MTAPEAGPPVCEKCRREPATLVNQWTGDPVCENCARERDDVHSEPLDVDDITEALAPLTDPDGRARVRHRAMDRLTELLDYQNRRIAALESAVAELTQERSRWRLPWRS